MKTKQEMFEKYIRDGLEKEVGIVFDEKMKILLQELNSRKNEIVSGLVLNIMKTIDYDMFGQTLRIHIKEISDK